MNRTLVAFVLSSSAFIANHALADDKVFIKSLAFLGSGCPPSSGLSTAGRLVDLNKDGLPDQFNLVFSNYVAKLGPGISILDQRRNCNLNLSLNLPKGLQYAIKSVRYRGFAGLPAGVRGLQQSTYQFVFFSKPATLEVVLDGPLVTKFQRQDQLTPQEWVWSPCGLAAPLNLRTQILLLGTATRSAILRAATHSYGLVWRHCAQ